jgi:hypothetical protein
MTSLRLLHGATAALLLFAGSACAEPWPQITKASDASSCRQALVVATRAFASSAPKLSDAAPLILRDKKPALGIVLAPDGGAAEGGGFIVDEQAIEAKDAPGGALKALFLQRVPVGGFRLVVSRQKMNWQGDWYGLYVADSALDADKLTDVLSPEKVTGARIVFDRAWQQPWLIRDPDSGVIVGIDTQHPAGFLDDWIVYKASGASIAVACHIAFRPPAERAAQLPPAGVLRELAALLDTIVGVPAQDEGTYHATDRVRLAALQAWANAALRPWAMAEPYNSPVEIEHGLKAWSRKSAAFAAQHRRMQALYPRALAALAAHYRATLRRPPAEAAALAKRVLDRAVGAHFVFAKGT